MSQPPNPAPDGSFPPPSWAPGWQPPPAPFPPAPAAAPPRRKDALLLAMVGLAGLLVGVVGAGLVVTALFAAGAGHLSAAIADDVRGAVEDGMGGAMGGMLTDEEFYDAEPVEEFPPTEPGDLGPDPVLDAYAQGCFAGDFQACDDLFNTSPPLSRYEEYASTCGGRVKPYVLMTCTELG